MPGALIDRHCIGVQVVAYEAPGWGVGELWFDERRVVNHDLPGMATSRGLTPGSVENRLLGMIKAYFAGEPVDFSDVELDLDWTTPFQRAVAEALRAVPYGEVVTYGELAALAGHPNAQRAAGTFCAGNRFPLFIPCHRVVAADGLGSYGSLGLDYKRRLLALEGYAAL
jgi:methylated-DNA-[protein]-cysteine S-methyltransferase